MKPLEHMEPHEQRVVKELKELTDKREKLAYFIAQHPRFKELPEAEQERLRRQFDIMVRYEGVLRERIDHFPEGFTPRSGVVTA